MGSIDSTLNWIEEALIVHPDRREVIPLAPEAIVKTDEQTKNDCERNAAKKLLRLSLQA